MQKGKKTVVDGGGEHRTPEAGLAGYGLGGCSGLGY